MVFRSYNSLTNHYDRRFLERLRQVCDPAAEWIVSEKVDGANFHFCVSREDLGTSIRCARRNAFVEEGEVFYRHNLILEKYRNCVEEVANKVFGLYAEAKTMRLFGELFGGDYDHPDVPKVPLSTRVSKGVAYCPHNDFCAFDIMVDNMYVDRDVFDELLKTTKLPVAPVLMKGPLDECLKFDVENFESVVATTLFSLPRIPQNFAEGVVLSPVFPRFCYTGERAILKLKHSKFSERKSRPANPNKSTENVVSMEKFADALEFVSEFVNENRVAAVASKEPESKKRDVGGLIYKTTTDAVREALAQDVEERIPTLESGKASKDEISAFYREVTKLVRPVVVQYVKYA
eukprot:ANDGO_05458.mRNA.1 RNA ligase 2